MSDRIELTAEEKTRPYAKYYYLPSAPPAADHAQMLEDLGPLDPSKADRIQDADNLLSPGYTEGPSDIVYVALDGTSLHVPEIAGLSPTLAADKVIAKARVIAAHSDHARAGVKASSPLLTTRAPLPKGA